MIIRREDLRKTDFSDISNGKRLAPVHPGDVLLKDFIEPRGSPAIGSPRISMFRSGVST